MIFARKCSLVTHFRINLCEKPCGCSKCEKWFTQSSTRRKHLQTNIQTRHKELRSQQQSELKCKSPRSIVHDWLIFVDNF